MIEAIKDLVWTVKAQKLGFVYLILKQGEKFEKDPSDLKQSDIDYIKELYPEFDEDMKTDRTDEVYNILINM